MTAVTIIPITSKTIGTIISNAFNNLLDVDTFDDSDIYFNYKNNFNLFIEIIGFKCIQISDYELYWNDNDAVINFDNTKCITGSENTQMIWTSSCPSTYKFELVD